LALTSWRSIVFGEVVRVSLVSDGGSELAELETDEGRRMRRSKERGEGFLYPYGISRNRKRSQKSARLMANKIKQTSEAGTSNILMADKAGKHVP
jgi:hypothetical protein